MLIPAHFIPVLTALAEPRSLSTSSRLATSVGQRGAFLAIRGLRGVLALMSLERASAFMGWWWRTFAPWTKRHARALTQLEAAMPELSADQRKTIVRAMWTNLGSTFAEGLLLDRLLNEPERVHIENQELAVSLQRSRDEGVGAIFVSMHSGNWEAMGIPFTHHGMRVAGLYQRVQNAEIEDFLLSQRERLYLAGMISKGSHAMKRIVGLLKAGDGVAMLADQRQAGRGVGVPFFGLAAPSTPLPATLALRTGARLIVGRCKRVGPVQFSVELRELDVEQSDDHNADIARLTAEIQVQFEAWIRERPHEWMWAHRRWSREVRRP
jgi:KDO2-lipid IV(A) lauroyltransferase